MKKMIAHSRFLRVVGLVCVFFLVIYGMVYVDLVFRARSAYLEGEKYLEWNAHPELKKAYYDARLAAKEKKLGAEFNAGRLASLEYQQRLTLERFKEQERLSESSLKYAYVWFQTAVRLFSPPESRWVKLAREEMPKTLALWKKELDAKHIPYQDYMFE